MKTDLEKKEYIKNISNENDIHSLLDELLPEMGFSDVKITHEKGNQPEFGKDLIASRADEIENKKDWYAFVVKKGRVSGKSGSVREIENQVYECFQYPYKSIEQKKDIHINKVKVITNEHFSNGAKQKILDNNKFEKANIDFWDGERLINYINTFYPKYWIKGSKQYKKYIERLQNRIKTDNLAKSLSLNNKKIEKIIANAIEPKLVERETNSDGSVSFNPKKASTIVEIPSNSIIIGEPGSGKSTLFKTLSNEIILQNTIRNNQDFYPIILTFKELENSDFQVEKALEYFFKKDWNVDLSIDFHEIVETESCAIFIDALDELPVIKSKEKALKSIQDFTEKYPNIRIICSSRPSDYLFKNSETIGFRYLEIDALNTQQIELFLNNYFSENLIKSKSLLRSLRDSAILEKLPKTPLTIALITILFDEKEVEIPSTITDLYESFVNLLIGKTEPKDNLELIEIGVKHRLLCHIAKHLHTSLIQKISPNDLKSLISDYSKERGQPFDVEKTLDSLINQVGLLYKDGKGDISFKHLSFQEYFTAYEIFHHRQSDRNYFISNFNDLWWQNVAIFYAGMSKDSPILLEEILDNSTPKSLNEFIKNTGGIGKLLQALYNTPIEQRKKGVIRGIRNTINAIRLISENENQDTQIWRSFSKYGLMQIFGNWFRQNNWSITLLEPLNQSFEDLIDRTDEELSAEDRFELEFSLWLMTSIPASDQYLYFDTFNTFFEKFKSLSPELLATLHTHTKILKSLLNKEQRREISLNKKIELIKEKINLIPDFEENVNTQIKQKKSDSKKISSKTEKK